MNPSAAFNPADFVGPVWLATTIFVIKTLKIDLAMESLFKDVVKPWLANKTKVTHTADMQLLENSLTMPYAMVVVGYYYFFLTRRLVDIAFTAKAVKITDRETLFLYFREKISIDVARTKRELARTKTLSGIYLDAHLQRLSREDLLLNEFYSPIVESVLAGSSAQEIREVVLLRGDLMLSNAEVFFQNNTLEHEFLPNALPANKADNGRA